MNLLFELRNYLSYPMDTKHFSQNFKYSSNQLENIIKDPGLLICSNIMYVYVYLPPEL